VFADFKTRSDKEAQKRLSASVVTALLLFGGLVVAAVATAATPDMTTTFTGDWDSPNVLGMDPLLTDPLNLDGPNFVPMAGSPVIGMGAAPPTGDFFEATAYAGALDPAGADWTAGWTAFPAD